MSEVDLGQDPTAWKRSSRCDATEPPSLHHLSSQHVRLTPPSPCPGQPHLSHMNSKRNGLSQEGFSRHPAKQNAYHKQSSDHVEHPLPGTRRQMQQQDLLEANKEFNALLNHARIGNDYLRFFASLFLLCSFPSVMQRRRSCDGGSRAYTHPRISDGLRMFYLCVSRLGLTKAVAYGLLPTSLYALCLTLMISNRRYLFPVPQDKDESRRQNVCCRSFDTTSAVNRVVIGCLIRRASSTLSQIRSPGIKLRFDRSVHALLPLLVLTAM